MLFLASSVDAIDTVVVCACVGMRRMVRKISVCVGRERQTETES